MSAPDNDATTTTDWDLGGDEWAFASTKDFVFGRPTVSITTKYRLAEQIGQPGSFGRAHVAINLETRERCAVKLVSKKRLSPTAAELMRNEVLVMVFVCSFTLQLLVVCIYILPVLATGSIIFFSSFRLFVFLFFSCAEKAQ